MAALARDGVIGRDGSDPLADSGGHGYFRTLTTGHPVVMGRRTWDSLPDSFRPLPGPPQHRHHPESEQWRADGAERADSFDEALGLLEGTEQVFVIGGAEIYASHSPTPTSSC